MYVLWFVNICDLINKYCLIDLHTRCANLAIKLNGNILAVRLLAPECIQTHCLKEIHLEIIVPPLTLVSAGNGCEGYSTNICTTSKTGLFSEMDTFECIAGFYAIYKTWLDMASCMNYSQILCLKNQKDLKQKGFTPFNSINEIGNILVGTSSTYCLSSFSFVCHKWQCSFNNPLVFHKATLSIQ